MKVIQRKAHFLLIIGVLFSSSPTLAQSYNPDMMELDATNGLFFPPHPAFNFSEGGTIEFWIAADWAKDPGYDPVILSNLGSKEPLYIFSILGGRSGLSLQAGDYIGDLPFDFSDDLLHHIAFINVLEAVIVMIDGQAIGQFDAVLRTRPSVGLWVGSADDENAPFTGAIGGLRFWDLALEHQDLISFALRDVYDAENPHPDITSLLALSDFSNNTIEISEIAFDSDEDLDDDSDLDVIDSTAEDPQP